MKYNYTVASNSNQSVQTDSSNEENDASENVQTIYSMPVSIIHWAVITQNCYIVEKNN